jgi:hypothetical protein
MLVSNPERFVIIPNIDEGAKFVIAHEAKENISPKEISAITSNGTHIITPSKGFNAMREVEVDVNVDLKGSLQDKQVTITENGTTTITADEGFEGLSSVEVNSEVYEGFSVLDGGEFQEEFNSLIAQKVIASNLASSQAEGDITWKFRDNTDIIYVVSDKEVRGQLAFMGCTELIWLKLNIGSAGLKWAIQGGNNIRNLDFTFSRNTQIAGLLMNLSKVKKITINGRSDMLIFDMEGKVKVGDLMRGSSAINVPVIIPNGITDTFLAFNGCSQIPYIDLGEVSLDSFANDVFAGCSSLATLKFTKWGKNSILLYMTSVLTAESIHYIIWHSLNGENSLGFENEGATSRTLKLHATPYASWETWKLTKPSVEDCEFLGIDETEITKYGELTWEDIALNVKLITIGA